uniref:Reverse transcriptase domain-containing protein n=1 Tax=Parastrongyloides trichosuri TaxID=131310 RepID=A0A0N4Z3Z9_PARTI
MNQDLGRPKFKKRPVRNWQKKNLGKPMMEPLVSRRNNVDNVATSFTKQIFLMTREKESNLNKPSNIKNNKHINEDKTTINDFYRKNNRRWTKWTKDEYELLRDFSKICPQINGRFQYKAVAKEFNDLMKHMNGRTASVVQSEINAIATGINRHIPAYTRILEFPKRENDSVTEIVTNISNTKKIVKETRQRIKKRKQINKVPSFICNMKESVENRLEKFYKMNPKRMCHRFELRKYTPMEEIDNKLSIKLYPIISKMDNKLEEREWFKLQKDAKRWFRSALFTMKSYCFQKIDQDGFKINAMIKAKMYERRVIRLRKRIKKAYGLEYSNKKDKVYSKFFDEEKAFLRSYCAKNHYNNKKQLLLEMNKKVSKAKNDKETTIKSSQAAKIRFLFNKRPSQEVSFCFEANEKNDNLVDIKTENIQNYYKSLYSKPEKKPTFLFNQYLEHMKKDDKEKKYEQLKWSFDYEIFNKVVSKAKNFKTCGWDNIHTIVFKKLIIGKLYIEKFIRGIMNGNIPLLKTDVTTKGFMIYKNKGDKNLTENYRLICYSNNDYKLLRDFLYRYLNENINNWIAKEQRTVHENKVSTLDCLIMDGTITQELKLSEYTDKYATYIDLSNVFDKIDTELLIKLLRSTRLPEEVINVIIKCQKLQRIMIQNVKGECSIPLQRGCEQQDVLSPLLFQLIFSAASFVLNETSSLQNNHIVFMYNLKWFSVNKQEQENMTNKLLEICNELSMEVNKDKCAVVDLSSQEHFSSNAESLNFSILNNYYKYLGILQDKDGPSSIVTSLQTITKKCLIKVKEILKSPLNTSQVIKCINSNVMPALSYILLECHGVYDIEKILNNAEKIDQLIRTLMTKGHNEEFPMNYLRNFDSCKSRLYLKPKAFGLGLKEVRMEVLKNIGIAGCHLLWNSPLRNNLKNQIGLKKQNKKNLFSLFIDYLTLMGLKLESNNSNEYILNGKKFENEKKMKLFLNKKLEKMNEKENFKKWSLKMNYAKNVVNNEISMPWLVRNPLCQQKTREMFQLQQEDYPGLTHTKKQPNQKCLYCNMFDTCRHITSQCQSNEMLELFKRRHNKVLLSLFNEIRKAYKLKPLNRKEALDVSNWSLNENAKVYFDKPWHFKDLHHFIPDLVLELENKVYVMELGITSITNYKRVRDYKIAKYCINSSEEINELNYNSITKGKNLVDEMKFYFKKEIVFIPIILCSYGEIINDLKNILTKINFMDPKVLARNLSISTVLETLTIAETYIARRCTNNH